MPSHTIVNPASLSPPKGYNHGVLAAPGGRLLFVAGQVGWDADEKMVSEDFLGQFRQALANVLAVVAEAGGKAADVVRITYYVTNKSEYLDNLKAVGQAYRELMGRHYVASTMVEVKGLVEPGGKVEIEATAVI